MDDPGIDGAEHRRALAGLARINALSRAGAGLWSNLRPLLGGRDRATVLDVAVGSGDVLADLVGRARRAGVMISARAMDVSDEALTATASRARRTGFDLVRDRRDVVRNGLGLPDASVDAVVCSLFLHHLEAPDVTALLREMARVARLGVVVNDLVRCRRGVWAANLAGRLLTRSPIVRVDSVRSVEGAFTLKEMRAMAAAAGLAGAAVTPAWPMRMTLVWRRP